MEKQYTYAMKLSAAQINSQLSQGLKPIYCLFGDEPLQLMETHSAILAAARKRGFESREVLFVERGFDWHEFLNISSNLSLFAKLQIIELRINSSNISSEAQKILINYAQKPIAENLLIMIMPKIDARSKKSKWYQALDKNGVMIDIWPLKPTAIMPWIKQRLTAVGLSAEAESIRYIAQRIEGNLPAGAQEIEKLLLLYGPGCLSHEQVKSAITSQARYHVFELIDSALMGNKALPRCLRILHNLKQEGIYPVQVLAPIVAQLRNLHNMSIELQQNVPIQQVTRHIWQSRKALIINALNRHHSASWQQLIQFAAQIDKANKQNSPIDSWLLLENLLIKLCDGEFLYRQQLTAN